MKVRIYLTTVVDVPDDEPDAGGWALAHYDPSELDYDSWDFEEVE